MEETGQAEPAESSESTVRDAPQAPSPTTNSGDRISDSGIPGSSWLDEARRLIVPLLVILLVAVTARLGYIGARPETIQGGWGSFSDSWNAYFPLGMNLRNHGVYSMNSAPPYVPCFVVAPGYPFFLWLLFTFHIEEMNLVRVVQGCVDAFSAVFVFLGAWFLFRRRSGAFLAGLMIALSPYNIHYARALLTDWQASFLMSVALCFYLAGCARGRFRWLALSGATAALAILTRPVFMLYPFVMAALLMFALEGPWRGRLVRAAGFLVMIGCVIVPWTFRNYLVTGGLVPVSTGSFQRTLMIGTYLTPQNWPAKVLPQEFFNSPDEMKKVQELFDKQIFHFRANHYKELQAANSELKALILERIRRHPWRYVQICIERVPMLWWNHSKQMWADPDPKGRWVFPYLIGWLLALPLLTRRRLAAFMSVWLFPLYITAFHSINHVESRYSLAGFPALSLFAGPAFAGAGALAWDKLRPYWQICARWLLRPENRRMMVLAPATAVVLIAILWVSCGIYERRQEASGLLLPKRADEMLHIRMRAPITKGVTKSPLTLPGAFAVEALLKPADQQRTYSDILGNHPGLNSECQGFVIQQDGGKTNQYKFMYGDGKGWAPGVVFRLPEEQWSYLAVTVRDKTIRVYINGVQAAERIETLGMENSRRPLWIGDWYQGGRMYNGWIREVRISSVCPAPDEIAKNWLAVKDLLKDDEE
ncbi:MAG: glycosyltransferase family 39 protein [Candidatus Sumerlaeota bacterium]|nr:glycosyltransferase family 39 protein [Candidatus Sumerlaeota bacterium]